MLQRSFLITFKIAKYELWNNIKNDFDRKVCSVCNSNEEEHQSFLTEVVYQFHFLQKNDCEVKVKQCHDVDCNFAKGRGCDNEEEHQKQWIEAEKATEKVLMI